MKESVEVNDVKLKFTDEDHIGDMNSVFDFPVKDENFDDKNAIKQTVDLQVFNTYEDFADTKMKLLHEEVVVKNEVATDNLCPNNLIDCKICSRKFAYAGDLRKHMRRHTGDKPFECKICNKKFAHTCNLKTHVNTHTGEKPFDCKVCNKKFATTGNLKSHMKTHTGEKPFDCKVCGRRFTRTNLLKEHAKSHTT